MDPDAFKEILERLIRISTNQRIIIPNLYSHNTIGDARTSISVSVRTRNKLKTLLKRQETYDDLIDRLLGELEMHQASDTPSSSQKSLTLVTNTYKRIRKTLTYYPEVRIEYSLNECRTVRPSEGFTFNLKVDNVLHRDNILSESDAMKLLLIVDKFRLFKRKMKQSSVEEVIESNSLLNDHIERIKMRYILYFKILQMVVDPHGKKRYSSGDEILLEDYWKDVYQYFNLPQSSFESDVKRMLTRMEQELNHSTLNKYDRHF